MFPAVQEGKAVYYDVKECREMLGWTIQLVDAMRWRLGLRQRCGHYIHSGSTEYLGTLVAFLAHRSVS